MTSNYYPLPEVMYVIPELYLLQALTCLLRSTFR